MNCCITQVTNNYFISFFIIVTKTNITNNFIIFFILLDSYESIWIFWVKFLLDSWRLLGLVNLLHARSLFFTNNSFLQSFFAKNSLFDNLFRSRCLNSCWIYLHSKVRSWGSWDFLRLNCKCTKLTSKISCWIFLFLSISASFTSAIIINDVWFATFILLVWIIAWSFKFLIRCRSDLWLEHRSIKTISDWIGIVFIKLLLKNVRLSLLGWGSFGNRGRWGVEFVFSEWVLKVEKIHEWGLGLSFFVVGLRLKVTSLLKIN